MSDNISDNILEIVDLKKTYPGVVALDHVSINVKRGEIHAIVGENGTGKSTLIKAISGAIVPDEGAICFDGKKYAHLDPKLSAHIGIGVIYQEFNLVPALSVAENIFLGNYYGNAITVDFKEMNRRAAQAMEKIGVRIPPEQIVSGLTVGHQQIVEITRSLVKDIKLLIMDEPSAPLTKSEVAQMFGIVRKLKEQGITIIYISHRLGEIFELADRVSIMRDGQYITTLNVAETNIKEIIKFMVGRELRESYPEREKPIGEEVLRVENLTGNGVRDISFTLHKGEILGFAGLLGCGRTETMMLLYGAAKATGGKIFLSGREAKIRNTKEALKKGIGLIPEDRKRNGVFLDMTIKWNTAIGCIRKKLLRWGFIVDQKKENELALEYTARLKTKTPSIEQLVANLSGGNQQKVVVSKVLAMDAEIMIFDEPTRGIDVGAKQEMYELIRRMVNEGKSVIMVSSEMEEVIGLSDRIVVLCEGRQMGILTCAEFDQERILTMASGLAN
ncbi:MAG TPA: sugar ABC transporter ATP-binding protein [Anaerovoracaceae bacterium]|nr:sugar ABC transporter ATP-binding protein [Anaerovoracaceae bacterium]